jgi:UDP-N-acetylmuramyl tripeptide synthase
VVQAGREAEFPDLAVPVIVVPDTRKAMPQIAVTFYDNPTAKLTSRALPARTQNDDGLMMESIARAAGDKTAYVGTLGFGINGEIVEETARPRKRSTCKRSSPGAWTKA